MNVHTRSIDHGRNNQQVKDESKIDAKIFHFSNFRRIKADHFFPSPFSRKLNSNQLTFRFLKMLSTPKVNLQVPIV